MDIALAPSIEACEEQVISLRRPQHRFRVSRRSQAEPLASGRVRYRLDGEQRYDYVDVVSIRGDQIVVRTEAPLRRGKVVQLAIDFEGRDLVLLTQVVRVPKRPDAGEDWVRLRVRGKAVMKK